MASVAVLVRLLCPLAEAAVGGEHYHALYAAGLLLFLITFAFNLAAWYFTRRLSLRSA